MQRPNPLMQVMGGGALFNVALMVTGLHAPAPLRYGGAAVCAAMGTASIALGIAAMLKKRREQPTSPPLRAPRVELAPEVRARMGVDVTKAAPGPQSTSVRRGERDHASS